MIPLYAGNGETLVERSPDANAFGRLQIQLVAGLDAISLVPGVKVAQDPDALD